MLFGTSFCRRCSRVKKRRNGPRFCGRALLILLAAALFAALLFIAPQWLLVLLVLALSAALFAAVIWCGDRRI